ncbi:MAG: dihydropteroate synthase [Mycobacteriales bacterium]
MSLPTMFQPEFRAPVRSVGGTVLDFRNRIGVVGIVNRTPDSFFDRGATYELSAAQRACEVAIEAGADWIDIGGVAFARRTEVSEAEEVARVLPLVRWLSRVGGVGVSVDTFRAGVAERVLDAGAHIINDTSGLADPRLAEVIAHAGGAVVICHSLPPDGQRPPRYPDVVREVAEFLSERIETARRAGIADSAIYLDPGHDLTKNTCHSLELTRRLAEITTLGYPTLVAVSNKDFIGEVLDAPVSERSAGSLAVMVVCVMQGARLLRVHRVKEAVSAARMVEATFGWRAPIIYEHNR